MDEAGQFELDLLRDDYNRVAGEHFHWFHCPFLFRDEDVELCKGYVLNQAFVGSKRVWTIQRKDLDNFYGSFFEPDFVLIQDLGSAALQGVIESPGLVKKVPVNVSLKGVHGELPIGSICWIWCAYTTAGMHDFPYKKIFHRETAEPFANLCNILISCECE